MRSEADILVRFGKRVRQLRKERGYSQKGSRTNAGLTELISAASNEANATRPFATFIELRKPWTFR